MMMVVVVVVVVVMVMMMMRRRRSRRRMVMSPEWDLAEWSERCASIQKITGSNPSSGSE
jgi:uncharacterized membrane protein